MAKRILSLHALKRHFSSLNSDILTDITFCGTHGDPFGHPQLDEIIQFTKLTFPKTKLILKTNGTLGSQSTWRSLANILTDHDELIFSIDGLEDTNHLYRQNASWESIITNIKRYRPKTKNAIWEFLVFQHNEHQLEQAKNLTSDYHFKEIRFKAPFGFHLQFCPNSNTYYVDSMPIYDANGHFTHFIRPSSRREFTNFNLPENVDFSEIIYYDDPEDRNSLDFKTLDRLEEQEKLTHFQNLRQQKKSFSCLSKKNQSLYIAADGITYPCCFWANHFYNAQPKKINSCSSFKTYQKYRNIQQANQLTVSDICHSELFNQTMQSIWSNPKSTLSLICQDICGKEGRMEKLYT